MQDKNGDPGIPTPLKLKVSVIEPAGGRVIVDKEIQKLMLRSWVGDSFDKHIDYIKLEPGHYRVSCGEEGAQVELISISADHAKLRVDGRAVDAIYYDDHRTLYLALPTRSLTVTDLTGLSAMEDAGGGGTVVAPMHGLLLEILVKAGARVAKGDKLAVLEAMKMQHEILAEIDGTVETIAATAGKQIAADDLILEIVADEAEETES